MTATITNLVASEHIHDLRRQAERSRHVPELARSRRKFSITGVFARRARRTAPA